MWRTAATAGITGLAALFVFASIGRPADQPEQQPNKDTAMEMIVKKTDDFEVDGSGSNPAWQKTAWQPLGLVNGKTLSYETKAKLLYSPKGIYALVDCEDKKLTCTKTRFLDDIFQEDVVEMFLWPDERHPLYFEYEISPLNVELPVLVSNNGQRFYGWAPWHYDGERMTRKATSVRGGKKQSMAGVEGWTVEFFIPFALLTGLPNTPPQPGSYWRADIFRIDYDVKDSVHQWAWETRTGPNFHDYKNFGKIIFEK